MSRTPPRHQKPSRHASARRNPSGGPSAYARHGRRPPATAEPRRKRGARFAAAVAGSALLISAAVAVVVHWDGRAHSAALYQASAQDTRGAGRGAGTAISSQSTSAETAGQRAAARAAGHAADQHTTAPAATPHATPATRQAPAQRTTPATGHAPAQQATPAVRQAATPHATPATGQAATPHATPAATPHATPATGQAATPHATPAATPHATPATGPEGQPQAEPQPTAASVYRNPFRGVSDLVMEGVDQGVDFGGAGPVYALGDGVITNATADDSAWPGGGWITYRLTAGPDTGFTVYLAEDVTPTVQVGQTVTSSTVIANMFNGGDGIQTGWASSDASAAQSQAADANGPVPAIASINFEALLQSLGVPAASSAS